MSQAFAQHYPGDLRLPYLYPTAEGGIQSEWSLEPEEVSLEINLSAKSGIWHALNLQTGGEESRKLNLEESDDWKWLVAEIRRLGGDST